jgi:ferritin-like metal-binding protein YciE
MSSAGSLKDVYIEEMRDLWSANDQMQGVIQSLSEKASDSKLKEMLAKSVGEIGQHTAILKSILEAGGGNIGKDHCKGMEGLVAEAKKHAIDAEFDGQLRDLVIIAQYQRMSHYGLAGFGTAAAYAGALGMKDDAAKLKAIVSDIYRGDEYMSKLAERSEQAAKAA